MRLNLIALKKANTLIFPALGSHLEQPVKVHSIPAAQSAVAVLGCQANASLTALWFEPAFSKPRWTVRRAPVALNLTVTEGKLLNQFKLMGRHANRKSETHQGQCYPIDGIGFRITLYISKSYSFFQTFDVCTLMS